MSNPMQPDHFKQDPDTSGMPQFSSAPFVPVFSTPSMSISMSTDTAEGSASHASSSAAPPTKKKSRRRADSSAQKRRCISTACVACRKRKSKCNGAQPSCAACASVYYTECVYDPNSDHRRKGVYREKADPVKAQNSTLQILMEAILDADEDDVMDVVQRIRTCDSLDAVAEYFIKRGESEKDGQNTDDSLLGENPPGASLAWSGQPIEGEMELARKMGEMRLENGSMRFFGGTSHLIYADPTGAKLPGSELASGMETAARESESDSQPLYSSPEDAVRSWTRVTSDTTLISHLMTMYFNWHYTYFTTLSKSLFHRDYMRGRPAVLPRHTIHCSSLLVNAMLALGCHFTSVSGAFAVPGDSRTKGDHFFAEAKRLIIENDEYEKPRLVTVQALALMSVREAGCAREAKGWVYSGMSFRMAQDIGLNLDTSSRRQTAMASGERETRAQTMDDAEIDARRVTFWGCFLFDKAWSNYLGRLPQLPKGSSSVPKYDVFPSEDGETWMAYTDMGFDAGTSQPSRTRAAGLELSKLCEISSDLLLFFYHPGYIGRPNSKTVELKKLSELHRRLENWRRNLPKELEPKEGQLPNLILTHMFYHLQYIHLFRPFLKYTPSASPLPSHVSPRRICTVNAGAISKLMRLYKKTYNLRQICNIAVYMIHSACTVHLLNLPEKTAKRDIIHGIKQLEEIAEDWLCARRTLCILSVLARKWGVELPEEASIVLHRTDEKYGGFSTMDVPSPNRPIGSTSPQSSASEATAAFESRENIAVSIQTPVPAPAPVPAPIQAPNAPVSRPSMTAKTAVSPFDQMSHVPQTTFAHDLSTTGLASDYLGTVSSMPAVSGVDSTANPMAMAQAISEGNDFANPLLMGGVGSEGNSTHAGPTAGTGVGGVGAVSSMGAWPNMSMQASGMAQTSTIPTYGQSSLTTAQTGGSSLAIPPTIPPTVYSLDGHDWLLRESASWQHNFDTWGMSHQQQQPPDQQFVTHSSNSPASTGNGSTPDNYMVYHGRQTTDYEVTLEGLGASTANLDRILLE